MSRTSFKKSNIHTPAPKNWRKFENAYFMALAPAIAGLIMGWGFEDILANRLMLLLAFIGAIVKGVGLFLANGEQYAQKEGNGAVIPNTGP